MRRMFLLAALILIPSVSIATIKGGVYDDIKMKNAASFDEAARMRHHLHQHPELCFKEKETSQYIVRYLRGLGLEVRENIGGTYGIKAVLRGNRKKPVVGIRADMDALPLDEATGLACSSQKKGVMHACGHDIHMTNALVAAKILSEMKEDIPGTVVFLFQPCEEGTSDGTTGGAEMMIKNGALKKPRVDALLGLHVAPGYPVGTVAFTEGPMMASNAAVNITILGKSSHGAFPEEGVDAIAAASSAVAQFQSIIDQKISPDEKAVFSIGVIKGGSRPNIIADKVEISGIVRTFSFKAEDVIQQEIKRILDELVITKGIKYDLKFVRTDTYVKNDEKLTNIARPALVSLLGAGHVNTMKPIMGSEDFAHYSHKIPSFFFFLGVGDAGSVHNEKFAPGDEVLKYGPTILSVLALEYLKSQQ